MTKIDSVLLLEPDIIARQPLADFLRQCGFRVLEAANPLEARKLLEAVAVDVVLADAGGDEAAVFALAQWIRETYKAILVVMAGGIDKVAARAGDLCGQGPALAKPYDHRTVLRHIRALLARRET